MPYNVDIEVSPEKPVVTWDAEGDYTSFREAKKEALDQLRELHESQISNLEAMTAQDAKDDVA